MPSDRIRVTEVLEATVGGTARHVLDLCEGLSVQRFELQVIWSPLRDPDPETSYRRLRQAGAEVVPVPMRRGLSPVHDLAALRAIRQALRRFTPHIVHSHSAKAGLLGRLAAFGRASTIYTPHAFPFLMDVSAPQRVAVLALERWLGRRTDRTVAVCASERQVALEARVTTPERCIVINNGIAPPPAVAIARAARLAEIGLPPGAQVILCVGDLRPQKGHTFAVQAMEAVVAQVPSAHLLIAGSGELEGRLLSAADPVAEHVHLLGSREDVWELLSCCDVFCQPSLWEGCPYAVIEAAASGCAIVGSDIPGIADLLEGGRCGWSVPAKDSGALAEALCQALRSPAERERRAQEAAALAADEYTLEGMLKATAELYEAVYAEAAERR